jgi:hypothetical protein
MATAYLKIENPGVAPKEAFTLLGASTKRDRDAIGKFGSGNKHGVAVLLRNDLHPTIFAGSLKMGFGTRPVEINDGLRSTEFARVVCKLGGKDETGTNRSTTEDLGYVLEYGASDWTSVALALREFVSNAIDRAVEEGEVRFLVDWFADKGYPLNSGLTVPEEIKQESRLAVKEYRKSARDFNSVVIEVVNENQVRAKAGCTRVFVPMNSEVLDFYNNLGKWFLHFSEPESLNKRILEKKNRNLSERKAAVIYRKGVRVREFESSEIPSLFDYNLDDLEMDEARKVDDWRVRHAAGKALTNSDKQTLVSLLSSFAGTQKYWEHDFDVYSLDTQWNDTAEMIAARSTIWQEAFGAISGENGVLATAEAGELVHRKGYNVVRAPEAFVKAAGKYGVLTPEKVLTQDDRDGREIFDANPDALAAMDFVWDVVQRHGMTNGKDRPTIKVYRKIMEGGSQSLGFYRDNVAYVNADIAGYGSVEGGQNALSQQLLVTVMEEVSHHVTGATDNSRDFQDYLLNLVVKLAKVQAGIL